MRKFIILFLALIVMSFGITLYLKADLGVDPITTFASGVANVFNVIIGRGSQISMTLFLIIIFFLDKKRIGIGTLVNAYLTGELLNIFMKININTSSMTIRLLLLLAGIVLFGIGLAMFVISELGEGPVDAIILIFTDKYNLSFQKSKTIGDIILVVGGYLMGSSIGLGTILGTFLTGLIMSKTIELYKRFELRQA
ncbi:MAG: hypothetical protein RIN55_01300 [Tissierellaceae bacterium]|nr:hypothetical protein [Tissierellaceae bacterium]